MDHERCLQGRSVPHLLSSNALMIPDVLQDLLYDPLVDPVPYRPAHLHKAAYTQSCRPHPTGPKGITPELNSESTSNRTAPATSADTFGRLRLCSECNYILGLIALSPQLAPRSPT